MDPKYQFLFLEPVISVFFEPDESSPCPPTKLHLMLCFHLLLSFQNDLFRLGFSISPVRIYTSSSWGHMPRPSLSP